LAAFIGGGGLGELITPHGHTQHRRARARDCGRSARDATELFFAGLEWSVRRSTGPRMIRLRTSAKPSGSARPAVDRLDLDVPDGTPAC